MELGLKLWSSNVHLLREAARLVDMQVFAYVELTVVPGTDPAPFAASGLPFVIHTATEKYGVNIADPRCRAANRQALEESIRWADILGSDAVILHPGAGDLQGALSFLRNVGDTRVLIENMPRTGLDNEAMVGSGKEELVRLMDGRFGLCLDLNHAVKAAAGTGNDYRSFIKDLLTLGPVLFHIADGHAALPKDEHLPIGEGDYDMDFLAACIQQFPSPRVTLEIPRKDMQSLTEDQRNARQLRAYFR